VFTENPQFTPHTRSLSSRLSWPGCSTHSRAP